MIAICNSNEFYVLCANLTMHGVDSGHLLMLSCNLLDKSAIYGSFSVFVKVVVCKNIRVEKLAPKRSYSS